MRDGQVELAAGVTLGAYSLDHRLGLGGMAEVWAARERASGRRVALKVLAGAAARNVDAVAMFLDEARIGARLTQASLVRIESCFAQGGVYCQVMELVDGKDLRRVMSDVARAGATVPWPLAAYVALDVAGALEFAHGLVDEGGEPLGIVHRDVSPTNIMITRDGRLRVLDFGIATQRVRLAETAVGVVKGKLSYMSPERILGQPATPASDVWSLGVVLWEMLAQRPLFLGEPPDVVRAILAVDVRRIDEIRSDVPAALAELCHEMLSGSAGRLGSAGMVARGLRRVLRTSDIAAATAPGALTTWLESIGAWTQKTKTLRMPQPSAEALGLPPPQNEAANKEDADATQPVRVDDEATQMAPDAPDAGGAGPSEATRTLVEVSGGDRA